MTNTTQSLVERLLAAIDDEDYGDLISVAKEAADRIERMTAPIAGLETTAEERARWAAAFTEFEADLEAGSGMGDMHDAQEAFIRSVPPVAIARLLRDFDRLTAHANAETARADAASADRVKANNEWRLDYNRLAVRLKAERAEGRCVPKPVVTPRRPLAREHCLKRMNWRRGSSAKWTPAVSSLKQRCEHWST